MRRRFGQGRKLRDSRKHGGISICTPSRHNNSYFRTISFSLSKTTHVTSDEIKEHLKQVKYPGFSRDIVSFGLVRSAALADGTAKVSLAITTSDPKTPLHLK